MIKKNKYLLILVLGIIVLSGCQKTKEAPKPNIVYILTDQWRGSALGYAGDPNVQTPNLDAFAKEAVNFTNAVSVTPVCTPHRAALLTGRYPTSTGMFLNDVYMPSEELCMAEILKKEGYNTGFLGKWHLDGHGRLNNVIPERRQGFDYWKGLECSHDYNHMPYYANDDPEMKYWEEYSPYAITKDANTYISNRAKDENPFLLLISIATPHFPHWSAPQELKDMYPQEALKLPPNIPEEMKERVLKELQGYYAHCTATDKAIGSVLEQLKALQLMDNTIVVFSSDHGEMMGGHGVKPLVKQMAWDESIRVPFLISYPSIGANKGAVVNAPINTPDILPSLLGLVNVKIPETVDGEDLSQLIENPDPSADRAALVMNVCPFTGNYDDPEFRAIRTSQYTYSRILSGADMLFDNLSDPYQMNNLVNKPEFAELQEDLDKQLADELNKIGDDFQPRDYYLKKWGYELDSVRKAIDYRAFKKGEGVVQSPKLQAID
ncbi:MAG: sulfatase [Cyclobacteriaceae bacterium]